ncbi:DUF3859 domain-containing protein [Vibrio sp. 10N.261.55.A7]|uniref:DUF3859 domain-containing protein n=1 Tax=Vibrio TaxID=662 RepID=UPI000C83E864|nr:DUF3859 domain-containing protein [Vibrio sp. 10N.261.55.A7]PMJ90665.1 hypothetical protein BCU12_11540 [Vibrio sp. 10N.261.55.A7]
MAKRTPVVDISSYGIYTTWDSRSKDLPKIREFTLRVPAEVDVEFGFIFNVKKAKGEKFSFCIDHPGILSKKGEVLEPFTGEEYVNSNDFDFYLGDTIQLLMPNGESFESNLGPWRMSVTLGGRVVAEKTFHVHAKDESQFWKNRGF